MPVLITAGAWPEAYRLQRVLEFPDVVFGDSVTMPQVSGIKTIILPEPESPTFVHEVLKLALDLNVTKIFPLKFAEISELQNARELFDEFNIKLMIPSNEWLSKNSQPPIKSGNLSILENGRLAAGDKLPENLPVQHETGVFVWQTHGTEIMFSLFTAGNGI